MQIKPTLVYYDILKYRAENLKRLYDNFQVLSLPDPSYDTPDMLSRANVILAPLGYYFGKEKIDPAPGLKVIGSNTTGHPHIDVVYAREKGIKVVTLKAYRDFLKTITPTAELSWGLIIAVTRNMIPAFHSVLEGRWERWPFGGEKMLSRMSLGIVGLGRLGSMVASYGVAFGMSVGFFDPFVKECPANISPINTLEKLVEKSDIVTIHVPHEPQTEGLISKEILFRFKKGAYLINTSRGELVDHDALLQCLQSGHIAGAAIDVIDLEFKPGFNKKVLDHPLVRYASTHSNLIITPHIGGSTHDAWSLTQAYTIQKVIEAIDNS